MVVLKETSFDVWLLLLAIILAVAANRPVEVALRDSIEKDYFLFGLIGILMFSLLRYVRIALVITIVILVVGANLPQELADKWNISTEIMFFALAVIVVIAVVNKIFAVLPEQASAQQRYASAYGAKALFHAISKGKVTIVERLVKSGVDVNLSTITGKTPLMLASYLGYTDIVHILLTGGADVFVRDKDGNSALNIAQRKGFNRIVSLLEMAIADK